MKKENNIQYCIMSISKDEIEMAHRKTPHQRKVRSILKKWDADEMTEFAKALEIDYLQKLAQESIIRNFKKFM